MREERRKKGEGIIKKIIWQYLIEDIPEELIEYGIVTITKTIMAPDTSYLDVYVSALRNPDTLTKTLALHAKKMEKIVCKNISIVKIPKIRFRYDNEWKDSFEVSQKIKNLES